jgi:hypothetical protein
MSNAWLTYRDYFMIWAEYPEVRFVYRSDLAEVSRYLEELEAPASQMSICLSSPSPYDLDPFILNFTFGKGLKIKWFDGPNGIIFPRGGEKGLYIFTALAPLHPKLEQDFFESARLVGERRFSDGELAFSAYETEVSEALQSKIGALRQTSSALWSPEVEFLPGDPYGLRHPIAFPINFGNLLEFLCYELESTSLSPGERIFLITYWRVLRDFAPKEVPLHLSFFVHLLDSKSTIWGSRDVLSIPPLVWEEGDIFVQVHEFPIHSEAPFGEYQLERGASCRQAPPKADKG